jgi:hypothetical protein
MSARRPAAVAERIAYGDHAGAAELFVESVAPGPGSWLPGSTATPVDHHRECADVP